MKNNDLIENENKENISKNEIIQSKLYKDENEKEIIKDPSKKTKDSLIQNPKIEYQNPKNQKTQNQKHIEQPKKVGYTYDAYDESNIFSKFFFFWALYILRLAHKIDLKPEHLGPLNKNNDSKYFNDELNEIWEGKLYKNYKNNALFKTIIRANLCKILITILFNLYGATSEYFQIILIKNYIDYFDSGADFFGIKDIKIIGIIYVIISILGVYEFLHVMMKQNEVGVRAARQLNCFIYNKLMKVSPSSFTQRATPGEIVNFIQVDSEKLKDMIQYAPYLFVSPFKIVFFSYLLFNFFGVAFFAGLTVMLLTLFINVKINNLYGKIQKKVLLKKDERMKVTTETFDNIKTLKLYNWENEFKNKIYERRDEEITQLKKALYVNIANIVLFWMCPILVAIATISLYQYLTDEFKISTMLIGLTIFGRLQEPIVLLPDGISKFIESRISLSRIEKFMREPEINENVVHQCIFDKNLDYSIKINNGNFTWGIKQLVNEDNRKKEKLNKSDNQNNENHNNNIENDNINIENKINNNVNDIEKKIIEKNVNDDNYNIIIDENEDELKKTDDKTEEEKENENNIQKENINQKEVLIKKENENDESKEEEEEKENESEEIEEEIKALKPKDQNQFKNITSNEDNLKEFLIPKIEKTSKKTTNTKPKKKQSITYKDGCKIEIKIPKKGNFDITLKNISLNIKPGEIIGIIGEVGSGKSSLLQSILNSLILLNPKECDGIYINGSIGYVSQSSWIQNDTIKNNVLFFREYNEDKYKEVLEYSQLNYDLSNFEGRDNTEIGEKGVNLSGGQKVRIALARALYSESDIFLLDDPISALDANVGKKIMKDCIIKYLNGKTRIVVTHALHYLKYVDRIFYMKQGRIEWVGSYDEIILEDFFKQLNKNKISRHKSSDLNDEINTDKNNKNDYLNNEIEENDNNIIGNTENKLVRIIKDEDEEKGTVQITVYYSYISYMGGICFMIFIVIVMFLWQATKGGSDYWIAYYSNHQYLLNKWGFLLVYSALGMGSILFVFFRIYLLSRSVLKLNKNLHRDMVEKLIKAPINLFHETITRGQILNRLSKDLEEMNNTMYKVGDFLVGMYSCLGAVVLCSIFDLYSLFIIPFMAFLGFLNTRYYLVGSRPLNRLERISRSPMLNVISETIPGNISIRAFNKNENYLSKFYNRVNDSFKINIFIQGVYNWYHEQFDLIGTLYITYLVINTILFEKSYDAQAVGVMFTYSLMLQEYLAWSFSQTAQLETSMVSMERCLKYTIIKGENPSIMENDQNLINRNWPEEGKITFINYSVKYRPNTEIVLRNLNIEINPKEKIGVVGRTGSGKSTICLCLFRILEPLNGQILIDDIDITTIGLDLLRQNITIIPQDPCLLEGSLKYNIDPFERTSNNEIIKILKEIGFEYTESDNDILNKNIEQNGSNLSVGEKQLICIARAIVRKTKIIVMDEATANIDMKTEEKIQKAMEKCLNNSTVITVAHRIKTIIKYDKILVLDTGSVIEFDSPHNLLKNENSLFYKLYSKSTM